MCLHQKEYVYSTKDSKYRIDEKECNFVDSKGTKGVGTKYSVVNKRSGRKIGQHKSKAQAEAHIERLENTPIKNKK